MSPTPGFRLAAIISGLLVASTVMESAAQAQFITRRISHPYYRRSYGYGSGYSIANIIRAQAQVQVANSQATLNYEKARSQYLANKKQWAENYFQMKEEREARDAKEREKHKLTPDEQSEISKIGLPRPLSSDALDPVTGHITWPAPLRASGYDKERSELDRLFKLRAETSQAEGLAEQIHAATAALTSRLRSHIEKMPAGDYMTGRKFLDSLDHAAHTPAG